MKNCFDIETVPAYRDLSSAPSDFQEAWTSVSEKKFPDLAPYDSFLEKAALFPEYSKVVCISVKSGNSAVRSFAADFDAVSEADILSEFISFCEGHTGDVELIGHYIKRYDIPFLQVRLAANLIKIPNWLKTYGVKPWELNHIHDTWEIWKGGNFSSSQASDIQSICLVLNIESPKSEFSGDKVGEIFYSDYPDKIEKIAKYCERDVLATAMIYNRFHQLKMI